MRLNPCALAALVVGIIAPYVWVIGKLWIQHRRACRPNLPDILLPLDYLHWHWTGRRLVQYRWNGRRWRRTSMTPIEPAEIPELSEEP